MKKKINNYNKDRGFCHCDVNSKSNWRKRHSQFANCRKRGNNLWQRIFPFQTKFQDYVNKTLHFYEMQCFICWIIVVKI